MDIMKPRVSVIRIPRQTLKQIDAVENQEEIEEYPLEKSLSNRNEPILYAKDEILTRVKTPRTSEVKSENFEHHRQSCHSQTIQSQPPFIDNWMKRSSNNFSRPELVWKGTKQWSHGLFNFSDDFNMCCYACTCWCCFRNEISKMMGEHWCLWFLNCAPLTELRIKFRQQYGIQGSIADDCCVSTFCPLCVGLQLANEGRDYGHRIFR